MFNPFAEKYSSIYLTKKSAIAKKKSENCRRKGKFNRHPEEKNISPVD